MGKFIDITNERYGRLIAIKYVGKDKNHFSMFLCKCDCGTEKVYKSNSLRSGNVISCGKCNYNDLTGQRFGRLTVIKRVENNKFNHIQYLCNCDCGKVYISNSKRLCNGTLKSCGCLRNEILIKNTSKHNMSNTLIYVRYRTMLSRCYNINNPSFKNYGGRGIGICDEWKYDFMVFYNWAINNGYKDNLTIDRIDNNGNYEPNNCRWITNAEQQNNKRNNHLINYKGETKTIAQWAKLLNIKTPLISQRLSRGWSNERALSGGHSIWNGYQNA